MRWRHTPRNRVIAQCSSLRRDGQGGDMGRHVDAVGNDRHRPVDCASHRLDHHHGRSERHHEPGAPLVLLVLLTEEQVRMAPLLDRVRVHGLAPKSKSNSSARTDG